MEKKLPRSASVCPLCKRPIATEWPAVKFDNGQEVHQECYTEFEEEQSSRQKLG